MLYLSRDNLRDMARQLLADYYGTQELPVCPFDAEKFAREYMNLSVRYERFGEAGKRILGCIAHENTLLELAPGSYIPIRERTVLLNKCLLTSEQRGRRNFTLAHECSHEAIYMLCPDAYRQHRCSHRCCSLRELNTNNDWFEWQANTLASELLMPRHLIVYLLEQNNGGKKIRIYPNNMFLFHERRLLRGMADFLGVSKTALLICLKQSELLETRSYAEYLEAEEIDRLIGG